MTKLYIALISGFFGIVVAFVPIIASLWAGYYSAVRQCNQDASEMETQLTSILLEISVREERMMALLAVDEDKIAGDTLKKELTLVESGSDERYRRYSDPTFKDHSLVSLVNQYNRLLRRVQFPDPFCPANPECVGATGGLDIDITSVHPAIEALQITGAKANSFRQNIDKDLKEIARQQAWHEVYGPVRLCSFSAAIKSTDEPWKLILLRERKKTGDCNVAANGTANGNTRNCGSRPVVPATQP